MLWVRFVAVKTAQFDVKGKKQDAKKDVCSVYTVDMEKSCVVKAQLFDTFVVPPPFLFFSLFFFFIFLHEVLILHNSLSGFFFSLFCGL